MIKLSKILSIISNNNQKLHLNWMNLISMFQFLTILSERNWKGVRCCIRSWWKWKIKFRRKWKIERKHMLCNNLEMYHLYQINKFIKSSLSLKMISSNLMLELIMHILFLNSLSQIRFTSLKGIKKYSLSNKNKKR